MSCQSLVIFLLFVTSIVEAFGIVMAFRFYYNNFSRFITFMCALKLIMFFVFMILIKGIKVCGVA